MMRGPLVTAAAATVAPEVTRNVRRVGPAVFLVTSMNFVFLAMKQLSLIGSSGMGNVQPAPFRRCARAQPPPKRSSCHVHRLSPNGKTDRLLRADAFRKSLQPACLPVTRP